MRHRPSGLALPIRLLAPAVCLLTWRGRLVAPTDRQHLSLSHPLPAGVTAIALSSVATATQSKHGTAIGVQTSARAEALNGPTQRLRSSHPLTITHTRMIGRMIRAFGADDVAVPAKSSENYVFG